MSKPKLRVHLSWPDLHRWFEEKYPSQFKYEPVNDWLTNDRSVSNGELVTASGECLAPDFDMENAYGSWDWDAIAFFMTELTEEFPEAVDEYGDVHIHYWW